MDFVKWTEQERLQQKYFPLTKSNALESANVLQKKILMCSLFKLISNDNFTVMIYSDDLII